MGMAAPDQDQIRHKGQGAGVHAGALPQARPLSKGGTQALHGAPRCAKLAAMSQSPRLSITQSQRLQLNLGLHTAIRLLHTDAAGLTRYLQEVAAENPALHLAPPPQPAPGDWLPRWSGVFAASGSAVPKTAAPKTAVPETAAPEPAALGPSLMAYVLDAIDRRMTSLRERNIALALAEALEPSGWLGQSVTTIAIRLKVRQRDVEAVLKGLQQIEPAGLFARNLAECLRLQAEDEGRHDAVMAVVLQNLDLLAKGDLARLATLAQTGPAEIAERFAQIRAMNPKPGTAFDALAVPLAREPDLLARPLESGEWEVTMNRSSLPSLRVIDPGEGKAAALAQAKEVQRMVEARNSTLLRVGRQILQHQIGALNHGAGALTPLTMAEVAKALHLHESTVSRVVAGTSVDTPHGLWWLRRLFSTGLGEGRVAGAALRDRLARLVAEEDKRAPASDEVLAAKLSQYGAEVARRTVAKYRAMLRIPAAHRRRQR